ncbi:YdeI/OmpD-associated family protein [Flavobacterium psychrotrophum]|uniref:YdeI/OmpD-associated family protein n=1 Tax=Flavobacterium psychrotrophum TaxID=2294119 RepID=UPI000E3204F3|nr:YdeI/OmpD-associated family protein [Flavobacterium psychrotrophum]
MAPVFFATQNDFRNWLNNHYKTETELLVGFYKKGSGKESMTWSESVDQALCFGWIDGVRRTIDDQAYSIRFTPRKARSTWSAVNIDKMEVLIKQSLVTAGGIAAYEKRTEDNSKIYSHERTEAAVLPPAMVAEFKKHQAAWDFFEAQPPGYKKVILHWITTAKQEKTQHSRFKKLLDACLQHKRLT